jgi:F-type H+-transporting ATPase subunit a
MSVTPDTIVLWEWGFVRLNATIVFTWLVMAVLVGVSWLVTRRFTPARRLSRGQNLLEVVVLAIREQIRGVGVDDPDRYLPFVGTLFLFVAVANSLAVVPGYQAPTGSLSTTTALALAVFVAVPAYGIRRRGLKAYLRQYARPTVIMLPFNIIGEFSRTLALAVRLFGNVMSAALIGAVLLGLAPVFFPVVMQLFGLLTGLIQAYIFAILAIVYIASGTRVQESSSRRQQPTAAGRATRQGG